MSDTRNKYSNILQGGMMEHICMFVQQVGIKSVAGSLVDQIWVCENITCCASRFFDFQHPTISTGTSRLLVSHVASVLAPTSPLMLGTFSWQFGPQKFRTPWLPSHTYRVFGVALHATNRYRFNIVVWVSTCSHVMTNKHAGKLLGWHATVYKHCPPHCHSMRS